MSNPFLLNKIKERPRIKITLSSHDWAVEFIAFIFLIAIFLLPLISYRRVPDTIPVHFNSSGQPDGFGGKSSLLILPFTGLFVYLLLTIISLFPHLFNYAVKITQENAETQYRIALRLLRILKAVILILFTFLTYKTIKTATGEATGLGKFFLPVFLILIFGIIVVYLIQSLKNRQRKEL